MSKKRMLILAGVVSMMLALTACNAAKEAVNDTMSVGETLAGDFEKFVKDDMNLDDLSDKIFKNDIINFEGKTTKVSEGTLDGFADYKVTGFKSARKFSANDKEMPFIGYIFELDNSADAKAFANNLKSNADPGWSGKRADDVNVKVSGNKVFFLMSPKTLDN